MKFGLSEATAFKSFFKGISNVADEITILATGAGLRCQVTAKSGVSIFDVLFKKTYFDVYELDNEDYIKLVPSDISKILQTAKDKEHILFEVDAYELHLVIEGVRRRNFNISLLDNYDEFRTVPSLDFTVESEVSIDLLNDCVKDLELMESPTIFLRSDGDGLKCFGVNDYKGNVEVSSVAETNGWTATSNYSLSLFKEAIGFKDVSNMVRLKFGQDYPLQCYFEDVLDDVELTTLVSPIFNNEE